MQESNLLGNLLPTIHELYELIKAIREKYNIPLILPDDAQLAVTLAEERTTDEL